VKQVSFVLVCSILSCDWEDMCHESGNIVGKHLLNIDHLNWGLGAWPPVNALCKLSLCIYL